MLKAFRTDFTIQEGESELIMKKVKASLDRTSTFIFLTNESKEVAEKLVPATMAQLISLEQRLSAMKAKKSKPMPKPMAKPAIGGTVALKKGGYVTKKGNFTKKGPCK